jgi:hypothetical protein
MYGRAGIGGKMVARRIVLPGPAPRAKLGNGSRFQEVT